MRYPIPILNIKYQILNIKSDLIGFKYFLLLVTSLLLLVTLGSPKAFAQVGSCHDQCRPNCTSSTQGPNGGTDNCTQQCDIVCDCTYQPDLNQACGGGGGGGCSPSCPNPIACNDSPGDGCGGSCGTGTYCSNGGACNPLGCTQPPAFPQLVCNPQSGFSDDVCDFVKNAPKGYAGPNKQRLVARDDGPQNSGLPHAHQFAITDLSSGKVYFTGWVGDGTNPSIPYNIHFSLSTNFPGFTPQNGTRYNWYAMVRADSSIPASQQGPFSSSSWDFVYDDIKPTSNITNFNRKCYTPNNGVLPGEVLIFAQDNSGGSDIDKVYITLHNTTTDTYYNNTKDLLATPKIGANNTYTYPLSSANLSFGIYEISSKAVDRAANVQDAIQIYKFAYSQQCYAPWLQTQNGDVHANTKINIQGGP